MRKRSRLLLVGILVAAMALTACGRSGGSGKGGGKKNISYQKNHGQSLLQLLLILQKGLTIK